MTAYSYTDWSMKSADEQKNQPGISLPRDHVVNNPDRGRYWSATTAASALTRHVETTLTGDDRQAAIRMWNGLKSLHRQATESPTMTDRAMQTRQADAHAALGAYNGDLDHAQLEQLASVFDDVTKLQNEAQLLGIDPVAASRRMLNRAASRSVGYNVNDDKIEAEMRPLVESEAGSRTIANMNQSVGQLHMLLKDMPLDALDEVARIGQDTDYTDELREDHRRLNDILASIPLVLNPQNIEPETNFSVRMDTKEEATALETMVRWSGDHDRMPTKREIHRAFSSWRDNGMAESPYEKDKEEALGIVLGNTDTARENVSSLMSALNEAPKTKNTPIVVLTVEADDRMREALASSGRPVVEISAEADRRGVHLSSHGQDLPANRIELLNLTRDQANDPIERSLAVNALVGRSHGVGYIAGNSMSPTEAHAIHLAGTLRKLNLGMDAKGNNMDAGQLTKLRERARNIDSKVDAQRYYTAGHARPHRGVSAVSFEAANKYDLANKANAPGRDVMKEAYDSIPKGTTILTVDNPDNALNKWIKDNMKDRKVLYAEITRVRNSAEIAGTSLDGERKVSRESDLEVKIYDRPASARKYGFKKVEGRVQNPNIKEYRVKNERAPENTVGTRRVCLDKEIEWNDSRVRGAMIMVSGNANDNAINQSAQAIKVAQEGAMNLANSALILTDQSARRDSRDMPSAAMLRLASEMGVKATVIDGTGQEMPLETAREKTWNVARNFSQKIEHELDGKMSRASKDDYGRNAPVDIAAADDLGQLALASLPGMDAARAIKFAHTNVTLKEIREDKSEEMRKNLYQHGMPAETRRIINDARPWDKAIDTALSNMEAADGIGAKLYVPTDQSHPVELASGMPVRHAVFTVGDYDFEKQPVAAFIGNSERYREAGVTLSLTEAQKAGPAAERGAMVDPADVIDRQALRRTMEEMTNKGYGIGVALEEGVSRAVLEEAAKIPDAKVVIAAPGNIKAASPELRKAMRELLQQDRAAVIMPTNIAAHPAPQAGEGEERQPDKYTEDRSTMQDILARTAKVGVVVAASERDQSLHVVRHMIEQDKPIAAMVPQNMQDAGADIYSANMRLMRGAGKTNIQSVSLAQAPSANAYAEINDAETALVWENGVRRGNAGTFQSAKLSNSQMLRSGHHHREMGWGSAAHPISSEASVARFVEKAENGVGALGQYRQPTERELEARRLEREFKEQGRRDTRAARFTEQEFGQTSALHRTSIDREAGRSIEVAAMEENKFDRQQSDRAAARQAAAAGHSMN